MSETARAAKKSIPEPELMSAGHTACQGCAATLSMRYALKGLGSETILVIPACCWTVLAGASKRTSLSVPVLHAPFAGAAATACGVKHGLVSRGDDSTTVVAWAGDGGTFDIGLQSLSGAADRNEDILYVCYDNEAYMNTGIQRSGGTPRGAWTMTTPEGADRPKKDLDAIVEAHHPRYFATATPAFAEDLVRKFKKAREVKGFRFIRILSPCPPGWKYDPEATVRYSRLAVQTGLFPLYEVEDGNFRLNRALTPRRPVSEYLAGQGRYRGLSADSVARIQAEIDARCAGLEKR
ncbi:MAG: pyruvate synthase subunit beta [Elusimicrobia bacterium]|nr:pyruvate synthase subunit beta [Elusimicrobiota bacterium]